MANPEGNEFCVEPGPAHQQGQRTRLTRGYDRMVEPAHRRPVGARPASTPGFLSGILEKANVCRSDGSFAPVYPSLGGGVMAVIVVTRLRLSDPALFDEFFAAAVAVTEQAKNSDGNLGADVLADANSVFWTRTAWRARGQMQAFVGSEPHLTTMARIDDWCDEATFADWEQRRPRPARLATTTLSPTVRWRVSRTPQMRIKLVPSPRP